MTPGEALKKDIKAWKSEPKPISIGKLNEEETTLELKVGKGKHPCTLTYPEDYPRSGGFFLFCANNDDKHQQMAEGINDFADSGTRTVVQILDKMVEILTELDIGDEPYQAQDDEPQFLDSGEEAAPDLGPETNEWGEEKPKQKEWTEADQQMSQMKFVQQTSDSATLRLMADLKSLLKAKPAESGFSAAPQKRGNLDDLYTWEVKLFGFDGPIAEDMVKYKKKSGKDYIMLLLRFSKDYPYKPPFVRVVEPVFQFRTGHVTLGGAICMELLTNTGWKPFNDIEQIIIQVMTLPTPLTMEGSK